MRVFADSPYYYEKRSVRARSEKVHASKMRKASSRHGQKFGNQNVIAVPTTTARANATTLLAPEPTAPLPLPVAEAEAAEVELPDDLDEEEEAGAVPEVDAPELVTVPETVFDLVTVTEPEPEEAADVDDTEADVDGVGAMANVLV